MRGKSAKKRSPSACRTKRLKIGSDCAGLLAETIALEEMDHGLGVEHVLVSESDSKARALILENFPINVRIEKDILARDVSSAAACDIYFCGFPCQPFSLMGKKQGELDQQGRGIIAHACIAYIVAKLPKAFVLENVKGFLTKRHRELRKHVLRELRRANMGGNPAYKVRMRLLNCNKYGLPQSRPRVYIVGVRNDCVAKSGRTFEWPEPIPQPPLATILDAKRYPPGDCIPTSNHHLKQMLEAMKHIELHGGDMCGPWVADLENGFKKPNIRFDCTPCLTRRRCQAQAFWVFSHGRRLNAREMLRLQGLSAKRYSRPPCVSGADFRGMVGNAFCVNVIKSLLRNILPAIGFVG